MLDSDGQLSSDVSVRYARMHSVTRCFCGASAPCWTASATRCVAVLTEGRVHMNAPFVQLLAAAAAHRRHHLLCLGISQLVNHRKRSAALARTAQAASDIHRKHTLRRGLDALRNACAVGKERALQRRSALQLHATRATAKCLLAWRALTLDGQRHRSIDERAEVGAACVLSRLLDS